MCTRSPTSGVRPQSAQCRRPASRADALAQQLALEVGLGDAEERAQHGGEVRARPLASSLQPLGAGALTVAR
jgi:hypothetical protein